MAAINLTAKLNISDAAKQLKQLREAAKTAVAGVAEDANATETLFETLNKKIQDSKHALKEIVPELTSQEQQIKSLEQQIANTKAQLDSAASSDNRNYPESSTTKKLHAELSSLQEDLQEVKTGYNDNILAIRQFTKAINDNLQTLERARTELKTGQTAPGLPSHTYKVNIRNEMAGSDTSDQQVSPANSSRWSELQSALQGIISGFSAYQGILESVAGSSEKLTKIQARLQAVMNTTTGIIQVSNAVQATSEVRMAMLAKITDLWNAANLRVGKGLISMGVAANTARIAAIALNGALTMGIGAAIGIIIGWITKQVDKYNEAKKAAEESAKKQRESFESYASAVGQNAGESIARFEALKQKYNDLGDSLSAKKKFIKENADAFKELGVKIGDVNDADNLFINNSEAFITALQQRARAAAAMEVASEKYKQAIEKMMEAENISDVADVQQGTKWNGKSQSTWSVTGFTDEQNKELNRRAERARKREEKKIESEGGANLSTRLQRIYRAERDAAATYIDEVKKTLKGAQTELETEADNLITFAINKNNIAAQTLANAGITTTEEDDAMEAEKRVKAEAKKKLAEIIETQERNLAQSHINAMNEGKKKELALLDQNTHEKITAIRKARQKELDAYNGLQRVSGGRIAENLSDDREKAYAEQIKNVSDESAVRRLAIEEKYTNDIKQLYKSIIDTQLSEEERRISSIREQYDKLRESVNQKLESGDITPQKGKDLIGLLDASQQKEELNVLLDGIKSYQQQRLGIIQAYNKKEALLKDENGQLKEGIAQDNIEELNRQKTEALAAIDEAFASREESYSVWAESLANMSVDKLEEAIAQAKDELKKLEESDQGHSQKAAIARAQISKAEQQIAKDKAAAESTTTDIDKTSGKYQILQKTLNNVGNEFREIGSAIGGTAGEAIALAGTIATSAASIIDNIATLTHATTEGVENTANTASKAIQGMETASVILAIISAAIKIATTLYETFSGPSKETREYEALKEQYEGLVDIWNELIEKKKEYIQTSWGKELANVSDETLGLIKQKQDSQRELAKARLGAGASTGSHSYGYRMWQGSYKVNGKNWRDIAPEINKALGTNIQGMGDLADLEAEQLEWIRDNYSAFWIKMDGDYKNALENIIKYGNEAKETQTAIDEQWTQLSFDELYSDFVETLLDMESSAEDFADNFEKYMQRAIINSLVGEEFGKHLEEWNAKFIAFSKSDEKLTEQEVEELKADLDKITEEALRKRELLREQFGWDSSSAEAQSVSERGFQALSQETGNELNGRFSDIQAKVSDLRDYVLMITANGTQQLNETINIRDIMIQLRGDVADIRGYTQVLPTMNDTLSSMNRKLDNL